MVIHTNEGMNVHPTNVLDADLNITSFLNISNHLKISRKYESKSVSVKGVIVHRTNNARTVIMIRIKGYMHLWHACLIMTKVLVEILATVRH